MRFDWLSAAQFALKQSERSHLLSHVCKARQGDSVVNIRAGSSKCVFVHLAANGLVGQFGATIGPTVRLADAFECSSEKPNFEAR